MNEKNNNRISNVEEAKEITVIRVISIFGSGTKEDPKHYVYQYFDKNGKLLASSLNHR